MIRFELYSHENVAKWGVRLECAESVIMLSQIIVIFLLEFYLERIKNTVCQASLLKSNCFFLLLKLVISFSLHINSVF